MNQSTDAAAPDEPGALTSYHVRRAVAGHEESVGWIVSRFSPLLLAQAQYRLTPQLRAYCDPEDVVNDTWLAALPKLERIDLRDGRFTPVLVKYLATTLLYHVNNLARKHLRGDAKRRRAGDLSRSGDTSEDPIHRLPDDTAGAVTRLVRDEARNAIATALAKLDAKDREIILLRGIEQQPGQLVALALELTPQGVSMRYHRALDRLRALLPGSVFDELVRD